MRWVDISPHRLAGWLDGFYQRHDGATEEGLLLRAANGDTALLFPPPGSPTVTTVDQLLASLSLEKRLGLLLARRGACAVGISQGAKLESSKVERFYQQGRTAAGGWSQQRFARRRANQTEAGVREAADIAARILLPAAREIDALVCGGDRGVIERILEDPRLAVLAGKRFDRVYEVPEPRHAVLVQAITDAGKVRIRLDP